MHKFTAEMKHLERCQADAGEIANEIIDIMKMAKESAASYQDGDAAYDLLKKAAEAFLKDHRATHSTS